jgi:hypothetical protein
MATIVISKEARKVYMKKRTVKAVNCEPHSKKRDYGTPELRPCGFPTDINPMVKRGKRLGNIHKMYKFKGSAL